MPEHHQGRTSSCNSDPIATKESSIQTSTRGITNRNYARKTKRIVQVLVGGWCSIIYAHTSEIAQRPPNNHNTDRTCLDRPKRTVHHGAKPDRAPHNVVLGNRRLEHAGEINFRGNNQMRVTSVKQVLLHGWHAFALAYALHLKQGGYGMNSKPSFWLCCATNNWYGIPAQLLGSSSVALAEARRSWVTIRPGKRNDGITRVSPAAGKS